MHTLDAYRRDLARLTTVAAGAELAALKPMQLRRGLMALHAQTLAPRSIARTLSAWRSYYAWLARRGAIVLNPADGLRAPKRPHALPKALGIDQAARAVMLEYQAITVNDGLTRGLLGIVELILDDLE